MITEKSLWQKDFEQFLFCHNVFQKSSAAKVSEIFYLWEKVFKEQVCLIIAIYIIEIISKMNAIKVVQDD